SFPSSYSAYSPSPQPHTELYSSTSCTENARFANRSARPASSIIGIMRPLYPHFYTANKSLNGQQASYYRHSHHTHQDIELFNHPCHQRRHGERADVAEPTQPEVLVGRGDTVG